MTSLAQYANPVVGMMAESELGKRGQILRKVPSGDQCDHIAALLRRGLTRGVGVVQWELRTSPGVKFPQDLLDLVAASVEEACLNGTEPCWRVEVRH